MKPAELTRASALALSLAIATAANADPAPAKRIGPCAGVYASVTGLSDYRFDGFSESNHHPSWQVTAYCYRNDGFFVGTTWTGIDFEDTPRTDFEADWFRRRRIGAGGCRNDDRQRQRARCHQFRGFHVALQGSICP